MKRRLLNLLTLLSLLLCVAAVALWVRSHVGEDLIGHHSWFVDPSYPENQERRVRCAGATQGVAVVGDVRVWEYGRPAAPVPGGSAWFFNDQYGHQWPLDNVVSHAAQSHGFEWVRWDSPPTPGFSGVAGWAVTVPLWAVAALAAFPAVCRSFALARKLRQSSRQRRGHCGRCGYDLRATPGRCPECGTAASVTASG
jgi:hypothetical protein